MPKKVLFLIIGGLFSFSLVACSSNTSSSPTTSKPSLPAVAFSSGNELAFDGALPTANALKVCGSNKYGFIAEIQYTGPIQAKVTKHYGPIEPLANGMPKQMEDSGTVLDGSGGNVDLPFDHSFGGDFSMDISLPNNLQKLGQLASTGKPEGKVHIEIQMGEFPHSPSDPLTTSIPSTMDWTQYATQAEASILPGFEPTTGDAIAAQGDWVLDCGHPDYHSELHELTFLAYGHDSGNSAVVHTFYNPYLPSELYNANSSLSAQVNNPAALTSTGTVPLIPNYLINTVYGVATNKTTTPIEVPMLVAPSTVAPSPFTVCPPNTSGSSTQISYEFDVRPGVSVAHSTDSSTGCTTFTVSFGPSYVTAPPQGQVLCPVPWPFLNQNAAPYSSSSSMNLQKEIQTDVTNYFPASASTIQQTLAHRMRVNCYDQLSSPIGPVNSTSQSITTVTSQLSPVVGWVKATRS